MSEPTGHSEVVTAPGRPTRPSRGLGRLVKVKFGPRSRLTDELFTALAAANPDLRLERTAVGDLEIMAPAGSESSKRNSELTYQLMHWSKTKGKGLGVCFDSSLGSVLPNKAIRGPDAAWVAQNRWDGLTPEQREGFLRFSPDFVVELRSPSDRLPRLRAKMSEYVSQGTRLGWLIDSSKGKVEIYRPGRPVETLERPATLSGEDVLPGFVLDLSEILQTS